LLVNTEKESTTPDRTHYLSGERAFAALARAVDQYHRCVGHGLDEAWLQESNI